VLSQAQVAEADVSSWLFLGTGPVWLSHSGDRDREWALQLDTGMGSSPREPIIIGGLARLYVPAGSGADVGLLVRTATRGFVLGDWGAAVDLGGYQRWWSPESTGGQGSVVLGAPWGLTLSVSGGIGTNESEHWGACLGVDLARLTVYRSTGESWWSNPFPPVRDDGQ
jgi:hypothetical protein